MMQQFLAKSTFGWLFAFAIVILLSGCLNKPTQTRAEELDKFCTNKTGNIITTYVEFRGAIRLPSGRIRIPAQEVERITRMEITDDDLESVRNA